MHDLLRLSRLPLVGIALAASLMLPGAALADTGVAFDCAAPLPLEKAVAEANLVFVGTVTETASEGRSATVTVTEVWRGDVPSPVTVNGGLNPAQPAEDDRTFEAGLTYVFVPVVIDDLRSGVVVDGICSSTVPWTDELAWLGPPEVGTPLITEPSSPNPFAFLDGIAMPIAMAGLIGGGALALALLVARRRDA